MLDFIHQLYVNWLYSPFVFLLKLLEERPSGIYILIAVFVALVIAKNKIKVQILSKVINFFSILVLIMILIVGYVHFGPAIADFFKTSSPKTPTNSTTTPSTKTKPNTQTVPRQTVPSYQAPKRLFYSISCYGCWADGCPNDGYYYSGYDAYYYSYYYSLCQACSCNSLVGHSFWK